MGCVGKVRNNILVCIVGIAQTQAQPCTSEGRHVGQRGVWRREKRLVSEERPREGSTSDGRRLARWRSVAMECNGGVCDGRRCVTDCDPWWSPLLEGGLKHPFAAFCESSLLRTKTTVPTKGHAPHSVLLFLDFVIQCPVTILYPAAGHLRGGDLGLSAGDHRRDVFYRMLRAYYSSRYAHKRQRGKKGKVSPP